MQQGPKKRALALAGIGIVHCSTIACAPKQKPMPDPDITCAHLGMTHKQGACSNANNACNDFCRQARSAPPQGRPRGGGGSMP